MCPVERDLHAYQDQQELQDAACEAAEEQAEAYYLDLLADTDEVVANSFVLEGLSEDKDCVRGLNALMLACENGANISRIFELAHQIASDNKAYFVRGEVAE
jgi:hypothetical protein